MFLRGKVDLIKALAQQIQDTIEEKKLDIRGIRIPPRYHRELRRSIHEIRQKTGVSGIYLPGDSMYSELVHPADISKDEDSQSIVKIFGTRDASAHAKQELDVRSVCPINVAR